MEFVVMRMDLSSVLADKEWMVWDSFELAQKTAINFCGITIPLNEARRIIASRQADSADAIYERCPQCGTNIDGLAKQIVKTWRR